jgi:hypothetical protein
VVSSRALRLYRLILRAYPAAFRQEYGAEMEQLFVDQHIHCTGPPDRWIVLREVLDAARTAPRMRWEKPMNRVISIAVAVTVVVAAALAFGPIALVLLAMMGVAAWFLWGRQLDPIASAQSSRRWLGWLVAGGVSIGVGVAIPPIDGGELSSLWWTTMAVAVVGGIVMAIIGVLLAVSDRGHRLGTTANR